MPQVSVITPVYADTLPKVDWLKEALESVRSQTLSDFEVIVVDDCSPHPVASLRDWFDERFRWFRTTEQRGPAMARNTAVALARAEAVLPLDADDLLADERSLEILHDAWKEKRDRVVYGDLQRYEADGSGGFRRARVVKLAEYEFRLSLNLNGLLPVTAMHSKECHAGAGGWKPDLDSGMEDVEYWIAAGKAGFCGRHVQAITLLYRWHEKSRSYFVRHVLQREGEMRTRIREMHKDVYEGRFPMGCCGSGGSSRASPGRSRSESQAARAPTTLNEYSSAEKVWVQYRGKRKATFGVLGQYTDIVYQVRGPGHKLEVHVNDLSRFKRSGRGKDFAVGVQAPEEARPEPEAPPEAVPYVAPQPELAEIERLDRIAAGEPAPSLDALDLGNVRAALESDGWTVEKLAAAGLDELMKYKGVGPVTAAKIVNRAKEAAGGG